MSNSSAIECFRCLEIDNYADGDIVELTRSVPIVQGLTIVDELDIDLLKIKNHIIEIEGGCVFKPFDNYEEGDWVLDITFHCCDFKLRLGLGKDVTREEIMSFIEPIAHIIDNYE